MTPEGERIRSYLQAQAHKLTIPELADKVRRDMEQVREALTAVPADAFSTRPAQGEWSANEVAAHLTSSSAALAEGIRGAIDSGATPAGATDRIEPTDEQRSGEEWWRTLLSDREAILARARQASGDEHLDIKWNHPMFGDLNWREWLLFMRVHDLDHTRQLQSIAAQLADQGGS
jgi:uncharacterized damage-inducible protein DinB